MRFVTKATPIDCMDGKCHIKKLKSSRTCLTGYSPSFYMNSFYSLEAESADTHTHTHTPTSAQKQFQETRCGPGLKLLMKVVSIKPHFLFNVQYKAKV